MAIESFCEFLKIPARYLKKFLKKKAKVISMINLLWCDQKNILRDRKEKVNFFRTLSVVYNVFCEALEEFYFNENYHLFDPHVGDNLCQVRACQLTLLAKKPIFEEEVIFSFLGVRKKIWKDFFSFEEKEINFHGRRQELLDGDETCADFLKRFSLNFRVPKDLVFYL